jgi:hypothetical protein
MARYFSREAVREAVQALNDDPAHLEAAKLLTGRFVLRALDAPEGMDVMITFTFEAGRCMHWEYEDAPSPSATVRQRPFRPLKDGIARVTASYATFVKLDRGEMEPADAINSTDYTIEGSMLLIMPLMQAVDSWNRKIRSLPKEY